MSDIPKEILEKIRPYKTKSLYKYRAINDFLETIITNQEIYLAAPSQFNDPFDCYPRITYYRDKELQLKFFIENVIQQEEGISIEEAEKIAKRMVENEEWGQLNMRSIVRDVLDEYGVYSLTELNDNMLMWSHYANSHKGVCLEFDSSDPKDVFGQAVSVEYSSELPKINTMDSRPFYGTVPAMTVKAKDWSYEKEWRIIRSRTAGGPGTHKFDSQKLTGIILGAKIELSDKEKVIDLVNQYPGEIKIYQAVLGVWSQTNSVHLI
jgi:hypothetical protein